MVYKYTFVPKYKLNVNQLYQSAWAVITKHSRAGGLNNGNILSYSSRSWEVQDEGAGQFLLGALLLACRWPPSLYPHMAEGEKSLYSSYKATDLSDQSLTILTSFNPNHLHKNPIIM